MHFAQKFLFQITNLGQPIISVVDGNFKNSGELLLTHLFEGVDMQAGYMQATMENLHAIWKAPVNLATVMEGEGRIYTYDGSEFTNEAYDKLTPEAGASSVTPDEDDES